MKRSDELHMLPDNKISSEAVPSSFLTPDRNPTNLLIDYEFGGVDIRDTSQGLNKYLWQCNYEDGWIVLSNTVSVPLPVLRSTPTRNSMLELFVRV